MGYTEMDLHIIFLDPGPGLAWPHVVGGWNCKFRSKIVIL